MKSANSGFARAAPLGHRGCMALPLSILAAQSWRTSFFLQAMLIKKI